MIFRRQRACGAKSPGGVVGDDDDAARIDDHGVLGRAAPLRFQVGEIDFDDDDAQGSSAFIDPARDEEAWTSGDRAHSE